ncbi:MAG: hypothetical protein AAF322_00610 [Pseudomonadota bacterium]
MLARRAALADLIAAAPPSPATAHQGFGGRYDRVRPIWIAGRVEAAYFGLLHGEVTVQPDREARIGPPSDAVAEFRDGLFPAPGDAALDVEFLPVRLLFALDGRVSIGDRIEVIALRNCASRHQLRAQAIRFANGGGCGIARSGRTQTETEAC